MVSLPSATSLPITSSPSIKKANGVAIGFLPLAELAPKVTRILDDRRLCVYVISLIAERGQPWGGWLSCMF